MTNVPAADRMRRRVLPILLAAISLLMARSALAADCPGDPDALGTSRTIVVDPREHPLIGTMQYRETLPLQDHEVVLTFDDGPIPKYSNQVLAILASQCVKATFFTIGRMAREFPEGVRKLVAAGHSIGTHTQNHPLSMDRMPIERATQEIEDGIAASRAALTDPTQLSPFFRIPGLLRADRVEEYARSQGLQVWSADFPADDWRHFSSKTVHDLAISRIEAKGKGILLLHDIQARTVAALPQILRDLKARGFRIVHVVAATPDLPKTPTTAQQWLLHPVSETTAILRWQKVPNFVFVAAEALPGPAAPPSSEMMALPEAFDRLRSHRPARGSVPLPEAAPWPRLTMPAPVRGWTTLPVPGKNLFEIAEHGNVPINALIPVPHLAERTEPGHGNADSIARLMSIDASAARRSIPGSMPVTRPSLQPGPVTR